MARNSDSSGRRPSPSASDSEINGYLRDLLRGYNDRDTEAVGRHIKTLRDALERNDDDVIPTRFGGSVAKHTYVDGLSDIDVLFVVNDSSLSGQRPEDAIQYMENLFRQRLPRTRIASGDLAVTITFSDDIEIQVLPAIRTKSGIRIADPKRGGWSNVLHPERFAQKLTEVNQANNGQVIPIIKLAKPLAAQVIRREQEQISGYHMESLAIEAFINYQGPYDLRSMLIHFCNAAAKAVLRPITDSTGQSRYVDEYMGKAGSNHRKQAEKHFKTMGRRINACKSIDDLDDLFGGNNGGGGSGGGSPKQPGGNRPSPAGARNTVTRNAAPPIVSTRTFAPPRPYATPPALTSAPGRARNKCQYDLTPLSAANVAWLNVNQPRMFYDEKYGVIAGTFTMRASWDPGTERLTANPWHPANPVLEGEYQLEILLRYSTRRVGVPGIPNRYPPVFETGDRTLGLAIARNLSLADLHMYRDGECCLGFNIVAPCRTDFDLPKFFEEDITAWLYRLAYVERFGLKRARQDLWPEYDHRNGPEQYLAPLRRIAGAEVSGSTACPCGGGSQYAQCHRPAVSQCRADGLL